MNVLHFLDAQAVPEPLLYGGAAVVELAAGGQAALAPPHLRLDHVRYPGHRGHVTHGT